MSEPTTSAVAVKAARGIASIVQTVEGASNASFDLVPESDLSKITRLTIYTLPEFGTRKIVTRGVTDTSTTVGVVIVDRLASKDLIEARLLLEEQIAEKIERAQFDGFIVTQIEYSPLYDPELFKQMRVFLGVIVATVKGIA